jgi:hypothetical protein
LQRFGEMPTNRQLELLDQQFLQPTILCVNATAYRSPSEM